MEESRNSNGLNLVVVGDVAYNIDITEFGEKTFIGGSAYFAAVGASIFSKGVGVVARVGIDFDKSVFTKKSINIDGLATIKNERTAQFTFIHYPDGRRDFIKSERGAAFIVDTKILPIHYLKAKYIHLATAPPSHQLKWVRFLRPRIPPSTVISADTFEVFVKEYPKATLEVLLSVDMIFMNEEEFEILRNFKDVHFEVPLILKRGAKGASYIDAATTIDIDAPIVRVFDTSGAGEVLGGAFLALRSKGVSIAGALRKAVRIASLSVTDFGVDHL